MKAHDGAWNPSTAEGGGHDSSHLLAANFVASTRRETEAVSVVMNALADFVR
jgi:hypothetical protein